MLKKTNSRSRCGAAAVEFAIVAPLFFILLAGIIEFGQAFRVQHALSNAARRGCRTAIVTETTSSQVQQKVKAQCAQALGISESDVTVEIAENGIVGTDLRQAEEGAEISVMVSVPYSQACVGFFGNVFSKTTLSATCILEKE